MINQYGNVAERARQLLQTESYGAAAFYYYAAILKDQLDTNSWNGLVMTLSLMRKENDMRTVLARIGLKKDLEFNRDLITFAMMIWQNNPGALAEWFEASALMKGVTSQETEMLTELAIDVGRSHQELVNQLGEEKLKKQGLLSLAEYAAQTIQLDWMAADSVEEVMKHIKGWLDDPDYVHTGVMALSMLPDLQSEKLLRRVCRNEDVDPKIRTHALLSLRWLGIRGNVKLNKLGESFVINLDNPEPELTVAVPVVFKPALDRMKLWLAKQQGIITSEEYESHVSTDEPIVPEALAAKLEQAEFPSILQEVVHMLIRAAYDQYYPQVPIVTGMRQWSAALLMLMKDYIVGIGAEWTYEEPEQHEEAVWHRNWLISGSPQFYDDLQAIANKNKVAL